MHPLRFIKVTLPKERRSLTVTVRTWLPGMLLPEDSYEAFVVKRLLELYPDVKITIMLDTKTRVVAFTRITERDRQIAQDMLQHTSLDILAGLSADPHTSAALQALCDDTWWKEYNQ